MMRELRAVRRNRLQWHERAAPDLQGPEDVLVRPFVAARCDIDLGLIRGIAASRFRLGRWLGLLDPDATHVFGPRPFAPPFPLGHECVAEVLACGEAVRSFRPGDQVVVPFQISCGTCGSCGQALTGHCQSVPPFSMYGGVGGKNDGWGGALSDCLRVPHGEAMLVAVPSGVDPLAIASASDNLPDAWRAVSPGLTEKPGARVLVIGGAAKSIGLYAAGIAVALGAEQVDYFDRSRERLQIAERLGARACQGSYARTTNMGEYPIVVDASNDERGLAQALRATAAGGLCTSVGIFPRKRTGIPMMRMYSHALTLRNGVSSARPNIPPLLELIASGRLRPERVTTVSAAWDEAHEAFLEDAVKVIVAREPVLSNARRMM
jgi:threonine dehydrogenase-like Zn-dependent dehydrogenase